MEYQVPAGGRRPEMTRGLGLGCAHPGRGEPATAELGAGTPEPGSGDRERDVGLHRRPWEFRGGSAPR